MNRLFHGYGDYRGPIEGRRNGVLISNTDGTAVPYALWNLEERGAIMIDPGDDIYVGMIIGEHSRGNDLEVNPAKAKQLTNIRAAMKDDDVTPDPAQEAEPRTGDGLYRRRRAGRGHAEPYPAAQALSSIRTTARRAARAAS